MEMPSALDFHVRTLKGVLRLTPNCLDQPGKHFGVMEIADRIFNDSTKCSAEANDADLAGIGELRCKVWGNWRTFSAKLVLTILLLVFPLNCSLCKSEHGGS
jgi:hypothetical protein